MRPLIVYYSKTGNTAPLAQRIAEAIDADCIHVGSLEAAQGSLPWFVACGWRKP